MNYIYKLSDCNGLVYYGSTGNPTARLLCHKNATFNTCMSRLLDVTTMKMEILETLDETVSTDEVRWRERHYFESFPCVNKNRPITTEVESGPTTRKFFKFKNARAKRGK